MSPFARSYRPLIMGPRGAVGANHPLAAQAGLDALRAGGTAADAAVAVATTLGVVEPHMSGLGGDAFYHLHPAGRDEGEVFNGTGPAPASAAPDRFADGVAVRGPRSVSVPGMLGALASLHQAHGRLVWSSLFEAAIRHAREGFAVTRAYAYFAGETRAVLAADRRSGATFLAEGAAPVLAALIRQERLAHTLEEIAAEGAEGFYRGRLARRLAAAMAEAGVAITEADLDRYRPERQRPVGITYRGYAVTQTPPNSTGFTFLQMLKIAERFDLRGMDPAERIHVLVEAKKLAFLDRERHGTDPRHGAVPLAHLLSDTHADSLAARIEPDRAAHLPIAEPERGGETTYFCVVDAEGTALSAIQSLNSAFGSGVTAGETGILLNNRMAYWHLAEGHANRLAPGKRVRHTMNAPIVRKDGRLWAVFGTPGADHQVQVNLQVLTAMADLGADPQEAVEAPRWTSSQQGQGANWPHEGTGLLSIEPGFDPGLLAALEARGHRLERLRPLEGPCSVAVIRLAENGVRIAGS
ncbi:MAG: gamma-glutamyltransferase family protein, partial [Alphaproteobacteria bacterium]|nr:gamma-glutamyltransferase family protein [Alphaproteobacteria bacterium]